MMNKSRYLHYFAYLVLVCFIYLLTGCASTKPVYIPVPAKCHLPPLPKEPHYPIVELKKGDSPDKVAKAYVATVHLKTGYIKQLKKLLGD